MIVVGQNKIQVKMILTQFDSQFPLSSNANYSVTRSLKNQGSAAKEFNFDLQQLCPNNGNK